MRNRVRELRHVPASELRKNPKNWRTHPNSQREALRGVLEEIGIADAVICRETEGGVLELIDGHLRSDLLGGELVPVLVLDVDEAEAAKILATLDPLAAMAEADTGKLDALLREVQTGCQPLADMLTKLAEENDVILPEEGDLPDIAETLRHTVVVPYEQDDIPTLCDWLGVDELPLKLGKAIIERIKAVAN